MNLYVLALHIISVVVWFAGLFYIVRLFVYHAEAQNKQEPDRTILSTQYKLMQRRLWYGITWPGLVGAYVFGYWMAFSNWAYYFSSPWFILKLAFVFGLTLYHVQCHVMFRQLQKDIHRYSSMKYRIWNEVATVFLVSIVFIVVMKDTLRFAWGLVGLVLFSAMIFLAIRIYRKQRKE